MSENHLKEKSVQTKQGKIFYYIKAPFENKPTVIFLHGLSSNHTTWKNIIEILHKNGHNSLALDIRGHGLSDKTKKKALYNMNVFTEDLKIIIGQEKLDKIIFVGYSYGGPIAINYSILYPKGVSGLILISANHVNPLKYRKIKFMTPLLYSSLNLLAYLLYWQKRKKYYYYQYGQSQTYWRTVWEGLNTMPLSVNIWMLMQMGVIDFQKTIGQISAPILIVYAKDDPFLSEAEVSDMLKALPQAKAVIPNHTSHFLASRSQSEISQIILDFLKNYENSYS